MRKLFIVVLVCLSNTVYANNTPIDDSLKLGHSAYGKYIQLCSLAKETHRVVTRKHGTTLCKSVAKHHGKVSEIDHINNDVKNLTRNFNAVFNSIKL